jgi:hypothetical protein
MATIGIHDAPLRGHVLVDGVVTFRPDDFDADVTTEEVKAKFFVPDKEMTAVAETVAMYGPFCGPSHTLMEANRLKATGHQQQIEFLLLVDVSLDADEQSPPPSPLAASQRPCRPKLSRARRKLIGASHRFGLLHYLQIFIHYLQCIGEQYSANGQRQVIYFRTDDMASTRDWKAIPPALDINQPMIHFTDGTEDQRPNPVTNRSSGVGPIPGIEP